MDCNFGIGFYLFDRIFGTRTDRRPQFNQSGYEEAKKRFLGQPVIPE